MPPAKSTPKPRIAVLERRLQNPFGEPSAPVELKDASRAARWVNGQIGADHVWRQKHKGWDLVKPSEVADMDQLGGYTLGPDGNITRGERGQEVLVSMPKDWIEEIAWAKAKKNLEHMGNPNAVKQELVTAAGEQLGDQAADFLNRRVGPVGGVMDSYERIERTAEDE